MVLTVRERHPLLASIWPNGMRVSANARLHYDRIDQRFYYISTIVRRPTKDLVGLDKKFSFPRTVIVCIGRSVPRSWELLRGKKRPFMVIKEWIFSPKVQRTATSQLTGRRVYYIGRMCLQLGKWTDTRRRPLGNRSGSRCTLITNKPASRVGSLIVSSSIRQCQCIEWPRHSLRIDALKFSLGRQRFDGWVQLLWGDDFC